MQGLENVKQVARGHFFGWRLSGSHPCFGDWHAQFNWEIAGFQGHPLSGQRDWPFLLNPWLKQSSWWERYVWRPLQDEACCAQSWMFLKQVFDLEGAPRKDSILSLWAHFSTRSNCGKRCEVDGIMIAFAWLRSQRVSEHGFRLRGATGVGRTQHNSVFIVRGMALCLVPQEAVLAAWTRILLYGLMFRILQLL